MGSKGCVHERHSQWGGGDSGRYVFPPFFTHRLTFGSLTKRGRETSTWSRCSYFSAPHVADQCECSRYSQDGRPYDCDEEWASELLRRKDIHIKIDVGVGTRNKHSPFKTCFAPREPQRLTQPGASETTMWTCDFSHEYVTINADYRS